MSAAWPGILYFGGQGVGTDVLRLLAWTLAAIALLLLPLLRKLEHRRERSAVAVARPMTDIGVSSAT